MSVTSIEDALAALVIQHKTLLANFSKAAFDALKAENARLTAEVADLREALINLGGSTPKPILVGGGGLRAQADPFALTLSKGMKAPPLPPWPKKDDIESVLIQGFEDFGRTVPLSDRSPVSATSRSRSPRDFKLQTIGTHSNTNQSCGSPDAVDLPGSCPELESAPVTCVRTTTTQGQRNSRLTVPRATCSDSGSVSGDKSFPAVPTIQLFQPVGRSSMRASVGSVPDVSPAAAADERRKVKEIRRLRHALRMEPKRSGRSRSKSNESVVTVDLVYAALRARDPDLVLTHEAAAVAMRAISNIEQTLYPTTITWISEGPRQSVSLDSLADIMWMNNLEDFIPAEDWDDVLTVVNALRVPTTDEIIHEASRGTYNGAQEVEEIVIEVKKKKRDFKWFLNILVSSVVIVNMIAMGISMDHSPDHIAWFSLEIFCTLIYLFEMVYWLCTLGCRGYLCSENAGWNIADVTITMIAVLEMALEVLTRSQFEIGSGKQLASATKASVMLRALRAVRVVRLIKLVRSAMLRDLANMLVGFVIGIPSLLWVLFMFVLILCLFGMFSRLMFGPSANVDGVTHAWIEECGYGDDMTDFDDPDCPVHYLYGEEFFGTVGVSMFTCFRFMLGDYSTRAGKSLVVTFSQDYGAIFSYVFVAWMIVVIFGIFNIITAIFVDTTTAGLKHNDVKRKHAQQYERAYVKRKLFDLLERIKALDAERGLDLGLSKAGVHIELTEQEFMELFEDVQVKGLLQDLDVEVSNLPAMFGTFDGDDSGKVSLQELVEGILKLRGDPQKTDVIGCWVSTRLLHEKVDHLQGIIESRMIMDRPTTVG